MPSALSLIRGARGVPLYRRVRSWSQTLVNVGATGGLASYMAFVGYLSFGTLQRVLTCAPVQTVTGSELGDALDYGSGYEDDIYSSVVDSPKGCIPAEAHASWLPASLATLSIVALAVLALILVGYLLHMAYRYVYNVRDDWPDDFDDKRWATATRDLVIVPDALKIAMKGLIGASGIFMFAFVTLYYAIYIIALT